MGVANLWEINDFFPLNSIIKIDIYMHRRIYGAYNDFSI